MKKTTSAEEVDGNKLQEELTDLEKRADILLRENQVLRETINLGNEPHFRIQLVSMLMEINNSIINLTETIKKIPEEFALSDEEDSEEEDEEIEE